MLVFFKLVCSRRDSGEQEEDEQAYALNLLDTITTTTRFKCILFIGFVV